MKRILALLCALMLTLAPAMAEDAALISERVLQTGDTGLDVKALQPRLAQLS